MYKLDLWVVSGGYLIYKDHFVLILSSDIYDRIFKVWCYNDLSAFAFSHLSSLVHQQPSFVYVSIKVCNFEFNIDYWIMLLTLTKYWFKYKAVITNKMSWGLREKLIKYL